MKAVPDQIARLVPDGRRFVPLGTDGFGRSDTREALRRFFETDAAHVVVAVLARPGRRRARSTPTSWPRPSDPASTASTPDAADPRTR